MRSVSLPRIALLSLLFSMSLTGCGAALANLDESAKWNDCAAPRMKTGAWTAPALVERGDEYLETGRRGGGSSLERAIVCYDHALQLGKDNYKAHLGLGVANLILSKEADNQSDVRKVAKQHLGLAFIYSQAHLEPLYYLAELAAISGAHEQANQFLEVLLLAKYKPGPVKTLLGYIWKKKGNKELAREYFEQAIHEGWPIESAQYAREEK